MPGHAQRNPEVSFPQKIKAKDCLFSRSRTNRHRARLLRYPRPARRNRARRSYCQRSHVARACCPCQAPCTEPAVHVRLHMNMRVRESHCLATARGRRRMSARSIIGDYILNVIEANQMRQHGKRQSPASLTSDAARWRAWAACRARSGSRRARPIQHRITSDAARWRGCACRARSDKLRPTRPTLGFDMPGSVSVLYDPPPMNV